MRVWGRSGCESVKNLNFYVKILMAETGMVATFAAIIDSTIMKIIVSQATMGGDYNLNGGRSGSECRLSLSLTESEKSIKYIM